MKRPNPRIIGIEEGKESHIQRPEDFFLIKSQKKTFPTLEMLINIKEVYKRPVK